MAKVICLKTGLALIISCLIAIIKFYSLMKLPLSCKLRLISIFESVRRVIVGSIDSESRHDFP